MSKHELVSRLDCREMDLRMLVNDLFVVVQTTPGDEASRALRHVADALGKALTHVGYAASLIREMGDW